MVSAELERVQQFKSDQCEGTELIIRDSIIGILLNQGYQLVGM